MRADHRRRATRCARRSGTATGRIRHFEAKGEPFKVELVEAIPAGRADQDLQAGPLVRPLPRPAPAHTGQVPPDAFKLTKVAGAYWRGDCTADAAAHLRHRLRHQKELDAYLHLLEEAEKRDHRKLGRELDLFHLQEEAQGSVFWHPKGFMLYNQLEAYIRRRLDADGYVEVKTPQLIDSQVLGALRPLGQVPREHVRRARRGPRRPRKRSRPGALAARPTSWR